MAHLPDVGWELLVSGGLSRWNALRFHLLKKNSWFAWRPNKTKQAKIKLRDFLRCFFAAKSFTGILQNAPPTPWSFFARTDKSQAAQWQDPPRVFSDAVKGSCWWTFGRWFVRSYDFWVGFWGPNIPTTSIWKFKDNQILATTVRIPESQRQTQGWLGSPCATFGREHAGSEGQILFDQSCFEPSIEVKLSHSCKQFQSHY